MNAGQTGLPGAFWKTAISKVEPNKILVRGYDLTELVGKYSYADLTYSPVTSQ